MKRSSGASLHSASFWSEDMMKKCALIVILSLSASLIYAVENAPTKARADDEKAPGTTAQGADQSDQGAQAAPSGSSENAPAAPAMGGMPTEVLIKAEDNPNKLGV